MTRRLLLSTGLARVEKQNPESWGIPRREASGNNRLRMIGVVEGLVSVSSIHTEHHELEGERERERVVETCCFLRMQCFYNISFSVRAFINCSRYSNASGVNFAYA